MASAAIISGLAGFFVPVGWAGAALAALCALVFLLALARGATGLIAGAGALWIVGGVLSLAAGFSGQWLPAMSAAVALGAALVLGALLRVIFGRTMPARSA